MSGTITPPSFDLLPPFPSTQAQRQSGPFAASSLSGWADLRQALNTHLWTGLRDTDLYIAATRRQLRAMGKKGR